MPNINWIETSEDAQQCLPEYTRAFGSVGAWLYMDSRLDSWIDSELPPDGECHLTSDELRRIVRNYLRSILGHLFLTRRHGRVFYRPVIKSFMIINFLGRLEREKRIVLDSSHKSLMKKTYWREIVAQEIDLFMQNVPEEATSR